MKKLSIIVPAHNRADFLREALTSVKLQTYANYEVIVVDDESDEDIKCVVDELDDERFVYLRQPHGRQALARNRGIAQSTGEYLAFLDSDDRWLPEKLTRQVQYLDKHPDVDLVYGWIHVIDQHGERIGKQTGDKVGDISANVYQRNIIIGGMSMIMLRREVVIRFGVFDPMLTAVEDWDYFMRISPYCKIGVIDDYLVEIRHHNENFSHDVRRILPNLHRILERNLENCKYDCKMIYAQAWKYRASMDQYILNRFGNDLTIIERIGLSINIIIKRIIHFLHI